MTFSHIARLCGTASAAFLAVTLTVTAADDRHIRFPDLPGYRTLKADFHQHTVFSDGKVWPNVRVEESVRDGLDAMAITDHLEWQPHGADLPNPDRNRAYAIAQHAASLPPGLSEGDYWLIEQYRRGRDDLVRAQTTLVARPMGAEKEAAAQEILVVPGVEITRNQPLGHVNALFITDANRLLNPDPLVVLREAAAQGSFMIWNHPWSVSRSDTDGIARMSELHQQLFDEGLVQGIEVVNNDTFSGEALRIALERNLTMIGSTDIHGLIEWVYPSGRKHRPATLVFAREKTTAALNEALRERRTVVWFNNTLIGRAEWLEPLVRASLAPKPAGYRPDRRRFTIQERPDTSMCEIELTNGSDASFILRNIGPHRIANEADVLTVPAHSSLRLTVLTVNRLVEVPMRFEVLNAIIAPGRHLEVEWLLKVK